MALVAPFHKFIVPLLETLNESGAALHRNKVADLVADRTKLSQELRAIPLPSGRGLLYRNRIGWAFWRSKRAGFAQSAGRGMWSITKAGQEFLASSAKTVDEKFLKSLGAYTAEERAERKKQRAEQEPLDGDETAENDGKSPEENLEDALRQIRQRTVDEVLDLIRSCDDKFFERLVLDVLRAMRYGFDDASVQQTGGSGDGGVDGVISLDRLGLQKVYVQAKRWENSVGRPVVQAFVGALAGFHASQGVLITTARFTADAREYAQRIPNASVVLIDGPALAELMIDHEVGVTHRIQRVPKVDRDYFEEA
jgi:restriction system protein